MKYPLYSNHKEETPVTTFIPGKWYRCVMDISYSCFKLNKVYLCVYIGGYTYLVRDNGRLINCDSLHFKFVLEE